MRETLTRVEAMNVLDRVAGKLEDDVRGDERQERDVAVLHALWSFFASMMNETLGVEVYVDV